MDHIDSSHAAFQRILTLIGKLETPIVTEADMRLKIIDPIFVGVLGWDHDDIMTEEAAGNGFLDYKFSMNNVARLVVEAKRTARTFDLQGRDSGMAYKLSGPVFKNIDIQEGVRQAISYSAYKGTELACVTNGEEWVIFRSNRIGDGTDTLEGKAFVFTSLKNIDENFRLFFDLLSKEKVAALSFRGLFQEVEGRIIRHSDFYRSLRVPESARLLPQSEIIPEVDRLMTSFFQRLSDEQDPEMLEACFVETKESKAAEQKLLRLAEELVGHIRSLDTGSGVQLADLLDRARVSSINQFILLVGTKGAGKSTFLNRFFRRRLPMHLQTSVAPIKVNLADSDGDVDTILDWLRRHLLSSAEMALGKEIPTWEDIIGHMFFSEYQRWSTGTMAHLYKQDKEQFKIAFGHHIESIRQQDPMEYLRGLLRNFVKGRKKLPCLIFDNADHFSIQFQERVFQFARSLYEQEVCVVIVPITDKTSWQLSKQGALDSFENEALLLPSAPAKRVLESRINFVLKKMEDETAGAKATYFVGKGIRVQQADLVKFVRGLQAVFLDTPKTVRVIGQLANSSVREVLELARDVINSPHVGLDEAFKAYVIGSAVHVPDFKVWKALIHGRYDIFVSGTSKFVHNVFSLNSELETTPLLGLRILQALKDSSASASSTGNRYMSKANLFSYLMAMGIERRAISFWLDSLLKKVLVVNYDPTCVEETTATELEISPAGEQHWFWARGNFDYQVAMAEVTPFRNAGAFAELEDASKGSGKRRAFEVIEAFLRYVESEDRLYCRVPDHESYRGQISLVQSPRQGG